VADYGDVQRGLAPYAISATLVVVISIAVLAGALAAGGLLEPHQAADATPSAPATRAPIELSRNGRLLYWRTETAGSAQLWVTNVDGSQRRALATTTDPSRLGATRWSPDGNAIAYLDRDQGAVVLRLDGSRSDLPLPAALTQGGARLIDLAWSTDSRSIASTLRTATGLGGADVYVASATGGSWQNVTAATNGFLSQWISPDELLIHTQEGLIAAVRSDGTGLRPLTGLSATSPFLDDDGRLYFLAGQIAPTVRDQTVPVLNAAQARVWSMTLDGGDVRQETFLQYDDIRLAGRWPTGQFLVHRGASAALAFLSAGQSPRDTIIGVIDRVTFSPDRRTAIGLNVNQILRYDTSRPDQPVLLLSDIAYPDAWYPQSVAIARSSPSPSVSGPTARYAFAMHGILWATDVSGGVHLVRRLQTGTQSLRRLRGIAAPQWSPRGDRIVYFDVLANSLQGAIFVTDPTGAAVRVSDQQDAAGLFPSWSPDGNVAYTQLIGTRDSSGFGADSEVRIVTPTGARVTAYRAREIAFGGGRTFIIDNGKLSIVPQTRVEHSIVEVTGGTTRIVTSASFLSAGVPFTGQPAVPAIGLQLSQLGSSGDGEFLSARVSPVSGSIGFDFAIFSAKDGAAAGRRLPGQAFADIRWSPIGHLIGFTFAGVPRVIDAETGAVVASATEGRFAGWSPDGTWFYVARDSGLYAIALAGGDAVRISAFGVPVSTTP